MANVNGSLSVEIYRDSGPTSRTVFAEIDREGQLMLSAGDIGEAPNKFWGNSDYEFWVVVATEHKAALVRALMDDLFSGAENPQADAYFDALRIAPEERESDRALLALIEKKYKGVFSAVDEFRAFLESKSIPCQGGSWV